VRHNECRPRLVRTAMVFLRLLTNPPLRPFSLLARFLASLRTRPPRRPSATACGFLDRFFFTAPLHFTTSTTPLTRHSSRRSYIPILTVLLCYVNKTIGAEAPQAAPLNDGLRSGLSRFRGSHLEMVKQLFAEKAPTLL
jgi:hypothetical protein